MPDNQNNTELSFRFKRLTQLFWALELAFAGLFILEMAAGEYLLASIILALCAIMSAIYFLIRSGQVDRAAVLLFSMLSLIISTLMWTYGGIQDETLLGFPVLLLFAAVLGSSRLFLALLLYITVTVLAIGISDQLGWRISEPPKGGLHSASIIVILFLVISYSFWLLAEDLKRAFTRLGEENDRTRESQERIEQLVYHDVLTNLPNRVLARERFSQAMALAERESTLVCLMFLDLDDFKAINDSMGHQCGDKFLQETASRIQGVIRKSDTVCRQGGDEFLVVLSGVKSESDIVSVANKILEAVKQPVVLNGSTITSTVSIGITIASEDDFDEMCREADMAMYHSKNRGRDNFSFYDDAMNRRAEESRQLLSDIRIAINEQQFELYFQAKIDLSNNKVIGAEALIRWHHPSRGLLLPMDFIPAAELSGIIVDISEWVVQEACRHSKSWQTVGLGPLSVAVNISPVQFKRGKLLELIDKALEQSKLDANVLELEITESLLMDDSNEVSDIFSQLRSSGVELAIDDFGTGYSNLGYLKKFDVSVLKIDGSFVKNLLSNPENKAIVQAIIQMAKSLNLKTIAEGVETKEVAQALREMGCDMGQGYLWSKPLTAEEFHSYIKYAIE